MKLNTTLLAVLTASIGAASAASISVDFNNTTDAAWRLSGTDVAGPTSSIYWNTTSTASGTGQALHDDSNTATGATVDWASKTLWTQGDGNGSNDNLLAHAYLDDGGAGTQNPTITINNVPYATYRVYGLIASGQADVYTTRDFEVNGVWALNQIIDGDGSLSTTTAQAYKGMATSGGSWVEITGDGAGAQTQTGNYWAVDSSGSTLQINGQNRNVNDRGSITGLVIVDTTAVPEPSSAALLGLGGLALILRRRK